MYSFRLSKNAGLGLSAMLCGLSLIIYGVNFKIFGHNDVLVAGLAVVTFLLGALHYRHPVAQRRSADAETIGWQVMTLLIAGIYLARALLQLSAEEVKLAMTWAFVLQLLNYAGAKYFSKSRK